MFEEMKRLYNSIMYFLVTLFADSIEPKNITIDKPILSKVRGTGRMYKKKMR